MYLWDILLIQSHHPSVYGSMIFSIIFFIRSFVHSFLISPPDKHDRKSYGNICKATLILHAYTFWSTGSLVFHISSLSFSFPFCCSFLLSSISLDSYVQCDFISKKFLPSDFFGSIFFCNFVFDLIPAAHRSLFHIMGIVLEILETSIVKWA